MSQVTTCGIEMSKLVSCWSAIRFFAPRWDLLAQREHADWLLSKDWHWQNMLFIIWLYRKRLLMIEEIDFWPARPALSFYRLLSYHFAQHVRQYTEADKGIGMFRDLSQVFKNFHNLCGTSDRMLDRACSPESLIAGFKIKACILSIILIISKSKSSACTRRTIFGWRDGIMWYGIICQVRWITRASDI